MPGQVKAGTHKWLYNKLLSIFNERIKNTVEREVRKTIDKSVAALKQKMFDATQVFSQKMTAAKTAAINDGALDVDDDEEDEMEDQADPHTRSTPGRSTPGRTPASEDAAEALPDEGGAAAEQPCSGLD